MRWTRRVVGYETVKTGSKMAARYSESMGEVCEDAMIEPGCGSRALWCLASDLCEDKSALPIDYAG
jgi:hypothetical protein